VYIERETGDQRIGNSSSFAPKAAALYLLCY